jgi:lipoprotein-anchoring transpeptidase ErfK/SrfK
MRRTRRAVTVLTAAIVVLLTAAGGVAADRLTHPDGGPFAVRTISPPYTMLPVPPGTVDFAFDPKVSPAKPSKPVARTGSCPALPAVSPQAAVAARTIGASLALYDAPGGRQVRVLSNPTDEGQYLNVLVHEQRGGWLRVQPPVRPNGWTGWVRAANVKTYQTPYRIVVQRCAKKVTVFRLGEVVWVRPGAVGKPNTPTPTGSFYVDFVTPMHKAAYGPYMLSIGGFSNVLHQFGNGGTGQIALHGTSAAWSVGRAASNGCVRMYNADITALAKMIPAGTPVTITD